MVGSLHSKVINWGTEMTAMSYIKVEEIKGTSRFLTKHILRLRSIFLRDPLSSCSHAIRHKH